MTTSPSVSVPASPSRSPLSRRFIASFALLIGSSVFSTTGLAAGAASKPPPPKVSVAPVEERLVTEYEEITGRVDSAETVELRARVSGHLESVNFQAGQLVAT